MPEEAFAKAVRAFSTALLDHLPKDETLRKEPERIHSMLEELLELETSEPNAARRAAILREIDGDPTRLDRDKATEIAFGLQEILVRDAGAAVVYAIASDEQRWKKGTTSWLTWDQLFEKDPPPGLKTFVAGGEPSAGDVTATRRRLGILLRARIADMQVHWTRQARRRRNLELLARVLAVLLIVLAPLTALAASSAGFSGLGVGLAVLGGMLGAALAGTFKARDSLVRAADIEAFRDGLPAQILVGAAAGLAIVVLFGAKLVTVAAIDAGLWTSDLALGFLAGFSEPFFLGIVRKATTLGEEHVSIDDAKSTS